MVSDEVLVERVGKTRGGGRSGGQMYGGSRQRVHNRDTEVTMVIPCQEGGRAKGEVEKT